MWMAVERRATKLVILPNFAVIGQKITLSSYLACKRGILHGFNSLKRLHPLTFGLT